MSSLYSQIRYPSYYDSSIDDDALDNELATHKNDGLMSKEDKMKLDKINTDGSINVNAGDIICNSENQFVSQEQIDNWNSAVNAVTYDKNRSALVIKV